MDLELTSRVTQSIYMFGAGLFVGKITGTLSSLLIGAAVIYHFQPELYSTETLLILRNGTETLIENLSNLSK